MSQHNHTDRARCVLANVEEYFDKRADADHPTGALGPIPNEEMNLLMEVRWLRHVLMLEDNGERDHIRDKHRR